MSKKDFIALADSIIWAKTHSFTYSDEQILHLARFCQIQNPAFKRDRWIAYIAGECGKSGGKTKSKSAVK